MMVFRLRRILIFSAFYCALFSMPSGNIVFSQTLPDLTKSSSSDAFPISPLLQQSLSLYKVALEAYAHGDYPVAIVNAQKALFINPLEEECFLLLKQAKAKIGIVEKEGNRKDSSALNKTDQQNMFLSGMQYYLQKDYVNAKRRWEFLKVINDTFPELKQYLARVNKEMSVADSMDKVHSIANKYFQKAFKLYGDGDRKNALIYLDTTLKISPRHIEGLTLQGRIHNEIQAEYQKIVEYGNAVYSSGAYKKAIEIWQGGLSLTTDNNTLQVLIKEAKNQVVELKKLYISEALECVDNKDVTCALIKYKEAMDLTPDDTALVSKMAQLQSQSESERRKLYLAGIDKYNSGDYVKSADLFSQLLRIAPNDGPAKEYLDMCNLKIRKQYSDDKLESFRKKAMEMEQQDNLNEALYNWNQVLTLDSSATDANEALKRLTYQIEQKQKMMASDNAYIKSIELYKNGKYQEARDLWNLILEKDPGNLQIRQMLDDIQKKKQVLMQKGESYMTKGQWALAGKEFSDVLRIDPGNQIVQQKVNLAEKNRADEELENQKPLTADKAKNVVNINEINELFNQGLEFYMAQQFENALECWNKILVKDPENTRAQSYISNLKNKIKKLKQL